MSTEKIFSVAIIHYKQGKLWRRALDSILSQNYPFIQLVFADDGTPGFSKTDVHEYIQEHAGKNICSFKVIASETNQGTVSNVNKADLLCTGEYIYHMGADDALYDENVLSLLAEALNQAGEGICGVYGRSILCDEKLHPVNIEYVDKNKAEYYNHMNANEQFRLLCDRCNFPMGAMAFKTKNYKKYVPHDEGYDLIEDWPFFLRVTRNGDRFEFKDIPVALYRDGGVSRPTSRNSEIEKRVNRDYIRIYDVEIWPYCSRLGLKQILNISRVYDLNRTGMKRLDGEYQSLKRFYILKHSIKYAVVLAYRIVSKQPQDRPPEALLKEKSLYQRLKDYLFNPWG